MHDDDYTPRPGDGEEPEDLLPGMIANLDQMLAFAPMVAKAARGWYDAFEAEGLSESRALCRIVAAVLTGDLDPPAAVAAQMLKLVASIQRGGGPGPDQSWTAARGRVTLTWPCGCGGDVQPNPVPARPGPIVSTPRRGYAASSLTTLAGMYEHRARTAGGIGLSEYAVRMGCASAVAFTLAIGAGPVASDPVSMAGAAVPGIEARAADTPIGGTAILDQTVDQARAFPPADRPGFFG